MTQPKSIAQVLDRIIFLLEERGEEQYGGEPVTQTQHALQTALAAERENASPALVAAALLHDLGHLLHALPEDCAEQGVDDHHEELAHRWLTRHFGPEVTEPVRLHVAAKRYLCAVDPGYHAGLSEASRLSLKLQGGPFSKEEVEAFRALAHAEAALRLRRWDDIAKVADLPTPTVRHYRAYLEKVAKS